MRPPTVMPWLLTAALSAPTLPQQLAAMTISTTDGMPGAVIVLAADASIQEQHAAAELAGFLEQITGGRFESVDRPRGIGSNICVGRGAAKAVDPGFSADGLGADGLVIRTIGNNLILAGGEPRGTPRLYTSWTPIGDVPLEDGGLVIMERSNHLERLRNHYCRKDVDAACTNRFDGNGKAKMQDPAFGTLTRNPVRLRETLGLRWLTQDFHAGDLVVFPVHGGLDNYGRRVRLSTDSRYQLASEPADDRWVSIDGLPPRSHGEKSRRELIC